MTQSLPGFSLAKRLRAGETVFSAWCGLASPLITDVMAREGFNTVTIDQQHGMWDHSATVTSIAGIRGGGAAPVVRVPLDDFGGVSRAFGSMLMGINPEKSLKHSLEAMRESILKPGLEVPPLPEGLPQCGSPVARPSGCSSPAAR